MFAAARFPVCWLAGIVRGRRASLALVAIATFSLASSTVGVVERLEEMRRAARMDPVHAGQTYLLLRQLLQNEQPSAELRLRMAGILSFAYAGGYPAAIEELESLRSELAQLEVNDDEVTLEWHLARAEIDYRYGYFISAYKHLLAALSFVGERTHSGNVAAIRWLDRRVQVAIHLMFSASEAYRSPMLRANIEHDGSMGERLRDANLAVALNDNERLAMILEEVGAKLSHDSDPVKLIDYWVLRCWQAIQLRSAAKFSSYLNELRALHEATNWTLLAAEISLGEMVMAVVFGDQSQIQAGQWSRLRESYERAAFPALLWLRLIPPNREHANARQGTVLEQLRFPFFLHLRNAEQPLLRAAAHVYQAERMEQDRQYQLAFASMQAAADLLRDIKQELDLIDRQWQLKWAQMERARAPVPASLSFTQYLLLIILSLVALLMVIILRYRMQRHQVVVLRREAAESQNAETARLQLEQKRSQFFANISHELKTPMTGLIGMASLLDRITTTPEHKAHLRTIQICTKNLVVLVNDLLELGRMDAGEFSLDPTPFRIEELLAYWDEICGARAREKALQFKIETMPHLPDTLNADPVRLSQVMINLIHFAIDYTPSGGVGITCQYLEGDSGTGSLALLLRAGHCEEMIEVGNEWFEPFHHGDESQSRSGSALGLTISHRLVLLMGGTIRSMAKDGKGCCFEITIPAPVADPRQATRWQFPAHRNQVSG